MIHLLLNEMMTWNINRMFTLSVQKLFSTLNVLGISELNLSANQWKDEMTRLSWTPEKGVEQIKWRRCCHQFWSKGNQICPCRTDFYFDKFLKLHKQLKYAFLFRCFTVISSTVCVSEEKPYLKILEDPSAWEVTLRPMEIRTFLVRVSFKWAKLGWPRNSQLLEKRKCAKRQFKEKNCTSKYFKFQF